MGAMKSMLPMLLLVIAATVLQAGGDTKSKKDGEKLLGTWMMVSGEKAGKKEIVDDTLRLSFASDGTFKLRQKGPDGKLDGRYTINTDKTPNEIDLTVQDKKFLGIYAFENDNLKLCMGEIEKNRPTEFVAPTKERLTILMLLKRDNNQPK